MKTKIYRLLAVVPIILCMVLSFAVPVKAAAVVDSDFYDYSTLNHDLSDYFIIKFAWGEQCWTYGIFLDEGFYDVSESNGLVTVTCSAGHDVRPKYMYRSSSSDSRYPREDDMIHSFTWIESSQELTCYNSYGNQTHHVIHSSENPVIDFDYDLWSNNALDVTVEFQPDLSGNVDRTVTDGSGASGLSQGFNMKVTNNGRSGVQYRMAIFEGASIGSFPVGGLYTETDGCIYSYITKQWVMSCDVSKMRHIATLETAMKQYKGCTWHYLASGGVDEQFFKYSQINFKANQTYTVIVEAVPNDSGIASLFFESNCRVHSSNAPVGSDQYVLSDDAIEQVYLSTFQITNLSDVTYNPSDSSNGIIPNSSHEDYARSVNSRDAFETENGTIDYTSYSAYDDPDSWLNDPKIKSSDEWKALGNVFYDDGVTSLAYASYSSGSSFTPASVSNLSSSIANYGSFLQSIFSYFPAGVFAIFNLALVMVVIIAIIKVVR